MSYWKPKNHKDHYHYNIIELERDDSGMDLLYKLFPAGGKSIDEMNFILFSTSGVHGTYTTIEDIEDSKDENDTLTFLVVHPRLVCLRYGEVRPQSVEDIEFLKDLRRASWKIVQNIG